MNICAILIELVRTDTPGIYYVTGLTKLPFQIVITSELEGEEYAAYRALTDQAGETDIERVITNGGKETDDIIREYYSILLSLIAEKNSDLFAEIRRDHNMEDTLMEIMKDAVDKKVDKRIQDKTVDYLKDIMDKLKYTAEQAMDLLNIPQDERTIYAGLVQKKM